MKKFYTKMLTRKRFHTLLDSAIAHFKNTEAVKVVLVEEKNCVRHFGIAFNTVLASWDGKQYEVSFRYTRADKDYATPIRLDKLFCIKVNEKGAPYNLWWASTKGKGRRETTAIKGYYLAVRELGTKAWVWFPIKDLTEEQWHNLIAVVDAKVQSVLDYPALAVVGADGQLQSVAGLYETNNLWRKYGKIQANAYYYKRVNAHRLPEYQIKPV